MREWDEESRIKDIKKEKIEKQKERIEENELKRERED